MDRDPTRPEPVSDLARAALAALASGRASGIDEAIDIAYGVTGADPGTRRPTRAELRAHAQAQEESELGEAGRLRRIEAALVEMSEVLANLEETVLSREPHGSDRPPPEVYGRAAKAQLDLDPSVHVRVTTSLPASTIAQALFEAGFEDPTCRSVETRHGRLDEIAFEGAYASYRIVRIPPRMDVDADRDLFSGRRIEHVDFSGIARQCARLRDRG